LIQIALEELKQENIFCASLYKKNRIRMSFDDIKLKNESSSIEGFIFFIANTNE